MFKHGNWESVQTWRTRLQSNYSIHWCCIFQLAFGVLRTPNAGRKSHFQHFYSFFLEKSKKFAANFSKKQVFLSLHQNAGRLFYSQKNHKILIISFRFTNKLLVQECTSKVDCVVKHCGFDLSQQLIVSYSLHSLIMSYILKIFEWWL